ncbi:helix-turn-helix transcriptional regulator [Gemmobacter serpentinus]|uniref:helix-turn-helix transcriptional regulator n=1 Tax=Gemmobacter serpentinus TaxID=2652247 RepID=UPI00124F51B3|nr:AraC family transcriptional regulator [Gemmobacter serpentinus]
MFRASVFDRLSQSNARLIACRDLGEGFGLARWSNLRDRVRYENSQCHVLSLYTENGTASRRADRPASGAGFPGALTLMPQGAHSDWQIEGEFAFLHLYIPDAALRAFAAEALEINPDRVALPEVTYAADAGLQARLAGLAGQNDPQSARIGLQDLLHHLLTGPGWNGLKAGVPHQGGLPPATLRRLRKAVMTAPDAPHRLSDLAALAGLSEFHFHRAFRRATGLTPQVWVERLRISRAEALILAGQPLAQVALDCGFAHQSHLTRAFRKARGMTPAAWRAACA